MLGFYKKNKSQFRTFDRSGFSLMEMVVVITIFIIITSIVMFNAPEFRERSSLELVAQEVAINIRGAQVYGIATRKVDGDYPSFGIHIDISDPDNQRFLLFPVYDGQKVFVPGGDIVEEYTLPDGYIFSRLEAGGADYNIADIVFRRPRPEAEIYVGGSGDTPQSFLSVFVRSIKNPSNEKEILISKNGNISTEF